MKRKTIIISIFLITVVLLAICCTKPVNETGKRNTADCGQSSCNSTCLSHLRNNTVMQNTQNLSCKLTSPELQKRKATVIKQLKIAHKERKELSNGFSYRFESTDAMLDLLGDFVKSERQCCDFFNFAIRIESEQTWLDITGPEGAKEFIQNELEM